MRAPEHAPSDPFYFPERRRGLAQIVERGVVGFVERLRVIRPHPERIFMRIPEDASRHGQRFERQRLGIFETTTDEERIRVADRFSNGFHIFLA